MRSVLARKSQSSRRFQKTIMDYIAGKYPDLVPLYDEIYNKHNRSYFEALEVKAEKWLRSMIVPLWIMKCLMAESRRGIR